MAKRKTMAELEQQIANLQPYQEAFLVLMKGEASVTIRSEEHAIVVCGLDRAAGGVVVAIDGDTCAAYWLSDIIAKWFNHVDPYFREIASKARRLQKQAVEERYGIQFARKHCMRCGRKGTLAPGDLMTAQMVGPGSPAEMFPGDPSGTEYLGKGANAHVIVCDSVSPCRAPSETDTLESLSAGRRRIGGTKP